MSDTEASPEARKIIDEAIMSTENYFGAISPKRDGHIHIYAKQIDKLTMERAVKAVASWEGE